MLLLLATCTGEDLVLPDEGAPRRLVVVSGDGQQGLAGSPLPDSVVVRVTDATGRPVQGVPIRVNLPDGGDVEPTDLTSDAEGLAALEWTLGGGSGAQQLEVSIGDSAGGRRRVTISATATSKGVDSLVIVAGDGQSGQVNRTLSDSLVVRAVDAFGNRVSGATVQWITSDGDLSPTSVVTDASGFAAAEWRLGRQRGSQEALARVDAPSGRHQARFTATGIAGPPPVLSIETQPSGSAVSGQPLTRQPVIQLRDDDGSPIATSGVDVTASVSGGTATLGGSTTATTNGQGRATFTNLELRGNAGTHTLTFTASGYLAATSAPVSLAAPNASPSRSTISASPTNPAVGATSTITVTAIASNGNPVPGATVTLSVSGNANTVSLTQPTNPTNSQGVTTGLLSSTSSGQRTVRAQINGRNIDRSVRVTFRSTGITVFGIVSGDNQSGVAGTALTAPLVVRVLDAFSNPLSGVTVQWQPAQGSANPTSSPTDNQGLAQTTWTLGSATGAQTLTARVSVLGTSLTATFSATATAPPQPVLTLVTAPPPTATDGQLLNPQPEVELRDANGGVLAQPGVPVTVQVASGGATLGGTTTVTTDNQGRATFTDLVLNGASGAVTLTFSAPGFTPVTSTPITVASGGPSPANSTVVVQPATVLVDAPATITVRVRTASNLPVSGADVSLQVSGGQNTVSTPPPTDASGNTTATFTSRRAERKTVTAQLGRVTLGVPQQVDVQPGPPDPRETMAKVPKKGEPGEPTVITVVPKDSYKNGYTSGGLASSITVLVTGANLAFPATQDRNDGTYDATYTPVNEGDDVILITLNGLPIRGSPFRSKVDD